MATMDLSINLQAIDNASANLDKVSTSIQNLGTHSQNTTNSINQLSSALQRLGSTSASIQNLSGIITSLNTSLSASSQTINSFNSSLNGSISHLNNFNANINNLSRNINNLSSNFATLSSRSSQLSQIIQSNITTFGLLNSSTQNTVNGFHQLQSELTLTSQMFANLRNNMSGLNQGLNQGNQGVNAFAMGLGRLSIAGIVVSEITQAFNVLKETLVEIPKIGLFHLAELEAGTLATAGGIRNALTQITTDLNTGFSTIGTASIDQAIGKSTQLMRQLREEIRDSIVTYDEVMNVYRGIAPLAGAIGADLSQMATLSVKMSDAVRLLNLPANQQLQEIRSIVQGAIKPSSSTLAMAVGMSNTEVAKAKEQGKLIEYINEKMAGFLEASARNSDTLYGRFAMLKKSLVEMSMISLEPLFVSAKDILKVANQNVSNFKKDEKNPNSEMGKINGLSSNSEEIAHNIKYAFQSTISAIVKVTQLFDGQGETIKLLIQGYLAFKAVSIATSIAQMGMATAGGLLTRVSTGLFQSLSNGVTPLSQIKNGFSSVSASITNFHTQMTSATSVSQRIGIVGTSVASMGRGFSSAVMSGMALVSNLVLLGTVATGTALALGAVDRNTGAFGGKVDGFVGWASNRLSALKNLMTDPFANTKEKMRFDVIAEDNLNNQYKQQITKARESHNSSDWENVDKTNEDIIKNQIRKISEIERDKQKVIELLKNTSSKSPDYSKTKADLDKYENYLVEERQKLESINKQLTDNREEAKKSIQFETSVKQVTSLKYNFNDDQMKDLGRALDSIAKNGETEYLKKTESTLTNTINTIISLKNKTNKTQEEAINLVSAEKQLMKVLGESDRGSLLFTGDDGKLSVDKLKQNRELFLTEVRKQNNSKSVLKSILGENYADKTELEIFKNYGAEAIKHIDQIRNAAKHLADTGQEVTLGKAMQEAFSNKVLKDAIDNIQELSKQKEDLTKDNASLMLEIHYMDQYGTSIKSTKEAQALLNIEKIKSLKLSDSNLKEKMLSEANAVLINARANQALNITLDARKEAEKIKDDSSKLNYEIQLMQKYGKSITDTTLLMNELEVSQGKFSKANPIAKSMLLAESAVKSFASSLKSLEDIFASIDEEFQKVSLMPTGDENSLDYKMKMADFEYNQKVKNLQKSASDSFDAVKKYQSQVDEEIAKNPNSVFNPTAISKQYNLDLKLSETSQTVLDNINKLIDTKSINLDVNVKGDGLNQVQSLANNYVIPFSNSVKQVDVSKGREGVLTELKTSLLNQLNLNTFGRENRKLTTTEIKEVLKEILAQTILESSSKKSNDGTGFSTLLTKYNNPGGYKANKEQLSVGENVPGGYVRLWTTEEINGQKIRMQQNFGFFRSLDEYTASMFKNGKLMHKSIDAVVNENNVTQRSLTAELYKRGYANDSKYIEKVNSTADKFETVFNRIIENNPTAKNNNQAIQANNRTQEFINAVIPVLNQSMESHKIKSSMTDQVSGKITDKSEWLLPIIDALSATSKNSTKLESVIEKLFKDSNFVNAFKSSFSEKEFYAKIQGKFPIIAKQDLEAKYQKDFKDVRVVEVNNTVNIDNKPKTTKQNTKKTDNKIDNKVSAENSTENTFDDSFVSKFEESINSKLKLDFEKRLEDLKTVAYKYINENVKIMDEVNKETTSNFNKSTELEKLQKSIGLDEKAKIKLEIEYDNKAFDDRNAKLNANIEEFKAKIQELDALIADKQTILSDQEKETYLLTRQSLVDGITKTQNKIAQNDKAKQDKAKNKILEDTTKETQTAVDAISNQFKKGFVDMIKSGEMDWHNFAKGLKDSIKGVFSEKLYKEFIDGFATSFANYIINPMFSLMTNLGQQLIAMFSSASIAGNSVSQVVSGATGLSSNNLVQGSTQQGLSSAISNSISSALGSPISLLAKGVGTLAVATGSATLTSLGAGMAFGANMGFTEALTTGWSLVTGGGSTAMGLGMMASPLAIIGGGLLLADSFGAFGGETETRGSGLEGTLSLQGASIKNYKDQQKDGGWFGSDEHWTEYSAMDKQATEYLNSISSKINTSLQSMMNQFEIKNVDLSNVQTNKFRIEYWDDGGKRMTPEQIQSELQNKYKELTKLALTKVINDGASSLINDNNFNFVKTQFNQDANKYSSTQDYETLIKSATDLLNSSAYLSKSETQGAYRNLGLYVGESKSAVNLSDVNNYKKDGEDYATTLMNIEKIFQSTTLVLKAFGDDVNSTFNGIGLSSLDARQKLVDEVGGIDAVNSAVDTVFNNMYNTKEKIDKLLQKSKDDVQVNLDKVGVSIDKFKDFNSFTDWLDTLDKNSQQFANGLKSINQVKSFFDQQDVKTKYNLQINIDQASLAKATGINSNQTASNLTDYATAHGTTLSKMLESYNGLIGGQTEINAKINTIQSSISEGLKSNFADYMAKNKISPISSQTDLIRTIKQLQTSQNLGLLDKDGEKFLGYLLSLSEEFKNLTDAVKTSTETMYNAKQGYQEAMINYRKALGLDTSDLEKSKTQGSVQFALDELKLSLDKYATNNNQLSPQFATGMSPEQFISAIYNNKALASDTKYQDLVTKIQSSLDKDDKSKDNYQTKINKEETRLKTGISSVSFNFESLKKLSNEDLIYSLKDSSVPELKALADKLSSSLSQSNSEIDKQISDLESKLANTPSTSTSIDIEGNFVTQDNTDAINPLNSQINDLKKQKLAIDINSQDFSTEINKTIDDLISKNNNKLKLPTEELAKLYPSLQQLLDKKSSVGTKSQSLVNNAIDKNSQDIASKDRTQSQFSEMANLAQQDANAFLKNYNNGAYADFQKTIENDSELSTSFANLLKAVTDSIKDTTIKFKDIYKNLSDNLYQYGNLTNNKELISFKSKELSYNVELGKKELKDSKIDLKSNQEYVDLAKYSTEYSRLTSLGKDDEAKKYLATIPKSMQSTVANLSTEQSNLLKTLVSAITEQLKTDKEDTKTNFDSKINFGKYFNDLTLDTNTVAKLNLKLDEDVLNNALKNFNTELSTSFNSVSEALNYLNSIDITTLTANQQEAGLNLVQNKSTFDKNSAEIYKTDRSNFNSNNQYVLSIEKLLNTQKYNNDIELQKANLASDKNNLVNLLKSVNSAFGSAESKVKTQFASIEELMSSLASSSIDFRQLTDEQKQSITDVISSFSDISKASKDLDKAIKDSIISILQFEYNSKKSENQLLNFGNDFTTSKYNLSNDKANVNNLLSNYNSSYGTNYSSVGLSFINSKSKDWSETQRNDYLNLLQLQNDYANSVKSLFESQLQIVTDYVNQINSLKTLQTTVQDSIATTLNNGLLSDSQKIINLNVAKANDAFSKLNSANTIDEFVNKANEFKSALEQQYQSQVDYLNKVKDLKTSFVNLRDDIALTKASFVNPITGTDNKDAYYTQKYNQYLTEFNSATEVEDKLSIAQKLKDVINNRYQIELDNSKKQLDFAKSLRSYLDGLKINEYSPYSRDAKLAEAKTQFDDLITRAKNGDTEAQSKVSSQADAYLKLAQEYFASSQGYTNVYDYVNQAIKPLAGSKTIDQLNTEINQKTLEIQQQAESRLSAIETLINSQIDTNETEFSLTKQYRNQVKSLQLQSINALNSLDTSISSRIADTNLKLDIENTRLDSIISELTSINGGTDILVSAINKMSSDVILSLSDNTLSTVRKLDGVNASVKLVGRDTGSNINPEIKNLTQVTSTSVVDLGKLLNTNLLDITKYSSLANQLITDLNTTTSGLPIATALANDPKYTTLNTLLTQLQTATKLVGTETASGITPSISELQNINNLSKSILEQLNVSTQGVGTSTSLLLDPKFTNLKTTLELLKTSTDFVNTSVKNVGLDTGNQINPTLISTAGLRDQISIIENNNSTLKTQIASLFAEVSIMNEVASANDQARALDAQIVKLQSQYDANLAELNKLKAQLNQSEIQTPTTTPTVTTPTPPFTSPTTTSGAQLNDQVLALMNQRLTYANEYNSSTVTSARKAELSPLIESLNSQISSIQSQIDQLRATNSYDVGTSYVTHDQVANIHKGEIIIDPASANALRKYGISMNIQNSSNQNNQSQNKYLDEIIKQLTIQNQELRYQTDSVQKSNSELKDEIKQLRKEMYEIKSKARLASLD